MPVDLPEAAQCRREPERLVGIPALEEKRERGADVAVLDLEVLVELALVGELVLLLELLRQRGKHGRVPLPQLAPFRADGEPLECVVPHRLEHRETRLGVCAPLDEAVVDERRESVEEAPRAAHGLCLLEAPASDEDRQPGKQALLFLREQIQAPLDRRAEGLLALRHVVGAARQQVEAPEPVEQSGRREHLRPRGGQLDRQREPVQPGADLGHGVELGLRIEPVDGRTRTLDEQPRRLGSLERRHGVFVLTREMEDGAAGHDDGQQRGGRHEIGEQESGRGDLLEVVDDEQVRALA